MTQATLSHAETNAQGWAETIQTAHEVHEFLCEEGEGKHLSRDAKAVLHELSFDGTNHDRLLEALEEQTRDSVLAVDVRSGWESDPSQLRPEEFQILLSTGGPALRLIGCLDENLCPCRVRMEHQDWGTPWTEFFPVDRDALAWFACLFPFDY